jgi:hypothetical protein
MIGSNPHAHAHYFTSNKSAEFLSLIHQIDVEIALINKTFPSEVGSSYYHAKNAAELMNKTYHLTNAISPLDFHIIYEEEQSNNGDNSTIQALVVANIVDETLRKYGEAYDVGYDLTNMSSMLISQSVSSDGSEGHLNNLETNGSNELVLVSTGDYQSAQALSREAIDLFERKLKPLIQFESRGVNIGTGSVPKVQNSLLELNDLLNNKAPPEDLMNIVHTQIHPSLQIAYNLEPKK